MTLTFLFVIEIIPDENITHWFSNPNLYNNNSTLRHTNYYEKGTSFPENRENFRRHLYDISHLCGKCAFPVALCIISNQGALKVRFRDLRNHLKKNSPKLLNAFDRFGTRSKITPVHSKNTSTNMIYENPGVNIPRLDKKKYHIS